MKYFILFFASLVIFSSCRTRKDLAALGAYDKMNIEQLAEEMAERKEKMPSYSAKMRIHYSDKYSELNLSARLKIIKDEAIWISISPGLGIEAVRALITPDSLKIINRLEKTYFVGGFDKTEDLLKAKLDFFMIQSLFYGNPMYAPHKGYVKNIEENNIVLRTHEAFPLKPQLNDTIFLELKSDLKSLNLNEQWIVDLISNRELKIKNTLFTEFEGSSIATECEAGFLDSIQSVHIDWETSSLKIDDNTSLPFKIPSKYAPMP